ncbi:WXG100 family type VII secretion target [Amycolatopsis sp. YIM 10]|uniref:WXG100 family type VII secretion target n=1 Tax=Amycolatopsis sp. YIM 10 TaxID=2653857 RepID=UPI00128FD761|nr:hypothetical protein [Amycolatopsis sp. YIM 10]QFU91120.1 hypothetical protein YIM_29770 [Amycolatopsis sp. YIM 10]
MDYARLPSMVQFALVDVEAHAHLARVEQASRMWRTVAAELGELADSLRRELDNLKPSWNDSTGTEFARQVNLRLAAIDEALGRVNRHQPWLALDELARQLLLTRTRLTGAVEWPAEDGNHETAAHLGELDRYFLAAAEAVLGAAGAEAATGQLSADCCPAEPNGTAAQLASAPAPGPGVVPDLLGSTLPPGSLSIPGLIAVPPGSPGAGGRRPAGGGKKGSPLDGSRPSDGSRPGGFTASGADGSVPGSAGSDGPRRIERVADPVPLTASRATPEAPQPPGSPGAAEPGSARGQGRMIPPMMMMPPMMAGAARNRRNRQARSLEDGERRTRTPPVTPGVPPRLRGRSALADPAGSGYRPVAMSDTAKADTTPKEALDHEVWQVANPGAATPLKPEPVEQEQPRRIRRPRA